MPLSAAGRGVNFTERLCAHAGEIYGSFWPGAYIPPGPMLYYFSMSADARKKYILEVPFYASPIEHLIELNRLQDIQIVIFGGVPDSPLNGGRFNYALDRFFLWNRLFLNVTKKQLSKVLSNFYTVVTKANRNGIPFLLAFTNMFVSREELNEKNLRPLAWLVASSQKHGVKNGVILNNKLLENFIRRKYGDKLVYVSSCTKYYAPDRILTPEERTKMYLRDSEIYDFVCLNPQDSRNTGLLKSVLRAGAGKITAICNAYCGDRCNSYHHYKYISEENKKILLAIGMKQTLAGALKMLEVIVGAFAFIIPRILTCSAFRAAFCPVNIKKILATQLDAGIVNIKLGRGFGDDSVDQVVAQILKFERTG